MQRRGSPQGGVVCPRRETVAMRHPRPMEHIARMLVDPSFQESLGQPTAEYVRRHDLKQRITNALGMVGFNAGEACGKSSEARGGETFRTLKSAKLFEYRPSESIIL